MHREDLVDAEVPPPNRPFSPVGALAVKESLLKYRRSEDTSLC